MPSLVTDLAHGVNQSLNSRVGWVDGAICGNFFTDVFDEKSQRQWARAGSTEPRSFSGSEEQKGGLACVYAHI